MKEYKKLDAIESEDIEKIREFAELMNELYSLQARQSYLTELINENEDLRKSVWTTQDGITKAVSDLEDSHLKNIIPYLIRNGVSNSRVSKEYRKRFGETLELPESVDYESE